MTLIEITLRRISLLKDQVRSTFDLSSRQVNVLSSYRSSIRTAHNCLNEVENVTRCWAFYSAHLGK